MPVFDLGTYGAKVELDDSQFNKSMNNVEKSLGKSEKSTGSFGKKVGKVASGAVLGLTGVLAGAGAAGLGMANNFAESADRIDKTSQKLGISTDAFQELEFAMGQVGVSGQTMEKGIGRLNQRLGDTEGNEKYREAIQNLGIATEDASGKTRNADDVFMESVQALHEIEDSTQQAALAQEIFGTKTARELMPAIQAGGDSIAELRGEAHELGAVISEDGVSSGVQWADTMDKMKNMMSGLFNSIAQQLLPVFQGMLDWIMAHMPQIQATFQTVFTVVQTVLGTVISVIGNIVTWLQTWLKNNQSTLENIQNGFMAFVDVVVGLVQSFVQLVMEFWNKYGDDVMSTLSATFEVVKSIFQTAFDLITDIFKVFTALFKGDWEGLWESVVDLLSNIWENLKGIIDDALKLVVQLLSNAWKGISDVTSKVWNGIKNFFKNLWKNLINSISKSIEGYKKIFSIAWNFIKNLTESVFGGIRDFFSGVWDKVTNGAEKFKDIFLGIWDKIKTGIKNVVNPIIGFINGLITGIESMVNAVSSAINKIPSFDVPSWVPGIGGSTFGLPYIPRVNLGRIPMLADGGLVTSPTMAMVGEGSEHEAVLPLSNLFGMLDGFAETVTTKLMKSNMGKTISNEKVSNINNNQTIHLNPRFQFDVSHNDKLDDKTLKEISNFISKQYLDYAKTLGGR